MIVRIVKLSLHPDKVNQFLDLFETVREQISSFEGCTYTEMLTDVEQSGVVFTYSLWDSPEALEKYRNSKLFKNTWSQVKPLFNAKAEAWTLNKLVHIL